MSPAGSTFDARARLAEIRARRARPAAPATPAAPEESPSAAAVVAVAKCSSFGSSRIPSDSAGCSNGSRCSRAGPAGFAFDARARLAEIRARRARPASAEEAGEADTSAAAVAAVAKCSSFGSSRIPSDSAGCSNGSRRSRVAAPSARPTRPGRTFSFEEVLSHDWDPGPEGEALRAEAVAMVEAAANPDLFAPRCQAWAAFFEAEKRAEADRRGRGHLATALAFLKTGWAERAMAAGWEEIQLFGLHQTRPWDRFDNMGAAYLATAPVAVTADSIALATGLTCRPKAMAEARLPGPRR